MSSETSMIGVDKSFIHKTENSYTVQIPVLEEKKYGSTNKWRGGGGMLEGMAMGAAKFISGNIYSGKSYSGKFYSGDINSEKLQVDAEMEDVNLVDRVAYYFGIKYEGKFKQIIHKDRPVPTKILGSFTGIFESNDNSGRYEILFYEGEENILEKCNMIFTATIENIEDKDKANFEIEVILDINHQKMVKIYYLKNYRIEKVFERII